MIPNTLTFFMLASSLCLHSVCAADIHPFHLSTAEMEMNAKTGRVEVALKIHGSDLERALTTVNNGKRVSIGDDAKAYPDIERYVNKHFVFSTDAELLRDDKKQSKADESKEKEWPRELSRAKVIGTEFRDNWLWIYFELELPTAFQKPTHRRPWQLRNTLLLDIVDSQINTISVRNKNGRFALRSSARTPVLSLPSDWLDTNNAIAREQ